MVFGMAAQSLTQSPCMEKLQKYAITIMTYSVRCCSVSKARNSKKNPTLSYSTHCTFCSLYLFFLFA